MDHARPSPLAQRRRRPRQALGPQGLALLAAGLEERARKRFPSQGRCFNISCCIFMRGWTQMSPGAPASLSFPLFFALPLSLSHSLSHTVLAASLLSLKVEVKERKSQWNTSDLIWGKKCIFSWGAWEAGGDEALLSVLGLVLLRCTRWGDGGRNRKRHPARLKRKWFTLTQKGAPDKHSLTISRRCSFLPSMARRGTVLFLHCTRHCKPDNISTVILGRKELTTTRQPN